MDGKFNKKIYELGYEYFSEKHHIKSGFDCIVFVNVKKNSIIFGISGSDGSTADWLYNNPRIANGMILPQFSISKCFMYEVIDIYIKKYQKIPMVSLGGNSLGGAVATYMYLYMCKDNKYNKANVCIAHNSPPIKYSIERILNLGNLKKYYKGIYNIIDQYDILNIFIFKIISSRKIKYNHVGKVIIIRGSRSYDKDLVSYSIRSHIDFLSLENIEVYGVGMNKLSYERKQIYKEFRKDIKNIVDKSIKEKFDLPDIVQAIICKLMYHFFEKYMNYFERVIRIFSKKCINNCPLDGIYENLYELFSNTKILLYNSTVNKAFNIAESDLVMSIMVIFAEDLLYDHKFKYLMIKILGFIYKDVIIESLEHEKLILEKKYGLKLIEYKKIKKNKK